MTNFIEDELEQAAIEWFQGLGYKHVFGPDISPDNETAKERDSYADVVLKHYLKYALLKINEGLPHPAIEEAYRKILIPQSPDMLANNQAFQRMLTDGVDVEYKRDDGSIKTDKVWLFDNKNISNNDWLVVNQFTVIENNKERRPDLVVFLNGLPLVVIELKSVSDENVNTSKAYNQLQTYKSDISSLFNYNSFVITSDGINARVGTITSNEERFMMWRTVDGTAIASSVIPQLQVLIEGMFEKNRFLDIIKHFVLFQTDGKETYKILAGYHQYHASNKAIQKTLEATSANGDRRIGVVWHTQGSGKSLTMVFYTGKLVLTLNNPTVIILTDRNDLDDQLFSTFCKAKGLLRQTPEQATSRPQLRELLKRESGGIIFTTIQKFMPGEDEDSFPLLTDRKNVVVVADEAHRSQYGLKATVKKTKGNDEAFLKYGLAKYMREAIPNASFIGFTGTPVEMEDKNTPAVFGDYIDIYDLTRAVEDGTTVKIFYESRLAKLNIEKSDLTDIDEEYEEITEYQENYEKEKLKTKWSRLEAIVGSKERIQSIAKDIVEHYENKTAVSFGKAMIVTMSRRISVELYDAIIKLRPDWHSNDADKGVIKVVMTGAASDPESWQKHSGNKQHREFLAKRMKDNKDPLKIVIVRDMWLTGFDVPSMSVMYVDKPMSGHNLMQAIARVNRVFAGKSGGLIVDYIGIADSLKNALSQYTDTDRETAGIDISTAVSLLQEKYEVIKDMLHDFNYSSFVNAKASERMGLIVSCMDFVIGLGEDRKKTFIQVVTELTKAQSLCANTDEAKVIDIEISFFKAVKAGLIKLITDETDKKKPTDQLDYEINQLISKSVVSENIVDVFKELGLEKPDISILSDEFLEEVKNIDKKNVAVELLKRLLGNKIRSIARTNLVQSKKFSELLQGAINKYIGRTIETTEIIIELIELAKEINAAHQKGIDLGLTDDEVAFYDALGTNDAAVHDLGDETLKKIAKDLAVTIKNSVTIDWSLKESVQAAMRVKIKKLLRKYGYPPDKQPQAVETVMKQAELMCFEETNN